MKAYERLLKYVVVRTPSDENSETVPSSVCQFDLARLLEAEMKDLGLTDVVLDDQCYLYGKLPATAGLEDKPAIGFIAHMDTVSDYCDHDIKPIVTENYDGGELKLGTSDTVLSNLLYISMSVGNCSADTYEHTSFCHFTGIVDQFCDFNLVVSLYYFIF